MKDNYQVIFESLDRVLVVVAHPDDAEMQFGGTIARLIKDGKKLRILVCTNGGLGSREKNIDLEILANIRKEEQISAAKILGVDTNEVFILDNKDCEITEYDEELIERIVYHMRFFRPDIVMTHTPNLYFRPLGTQINKFNNLIGKYSVNHRDHRAVGGATINAIYPMARDISFFPKHKEEGLSGIVVNKVLTTNISEGEHVVDITEYLEVKNAACLAHKSQISQAGIDTRNSWSQVSVSEQTYYVERYNYYDLSY